MESLIFNITYGHFLVLSAVLFVIGIAGVLLRRNTMIVMMSIELMLNAANISILTFARMYLDIRGHAFAFVVIAVAAAEAAVGLAIMMQIYRSRTHVNIDSLTSLKN